MKSYRPNVAAIFSRSDGRILICERCNIPKAWQFPQGGVDRGESPAEALCREVQEEIGFLPDHYEVIKRLGPYRYNYPPDVLKKKQARHPEYIGQQQDYFLCLLKDHAPEPDLDQEEPEFSQYKWILPGEFELDWLPDFKKDVYREVFRDFFDLELH